VKYLPTAMRPSNTGFSSEELGSSLFCYRYVSTFLFSMEGNFRLHRMMFNCLTHGTVCVQPRGWFAGRVSYVDSSGICCRNVL